MPKTNTETFTVPAERWLSIADANMCGRLTEQKGDKPVTARAVPFQGGLFMICGSAHGQYGKSHQPYASGYRLLPASLYKGETTTIYHDETAINAGLRDRGDLTGLILSYMGQRMVCVNQVEFIMGLPTTHPLSMGEAKEFDVEERKLGWRSQWYRGKSPEWFSLNGHPVSVYRGHSTLGSNQGTLFWKHKGKLHELSIADDVELESPTLPSDHAGQDQVRSEDQAQLSLF